MYSISINGSQGLFMEISSKFIGKRIREARNIRGKTQTDLAQKLGKTAGAISQLEQGNVQVTVIELNRIAEYLIKPIEYFFGEEYTGDDIQTLIAVIRKTPPEVRREQIAIIQSMFYLQNISDETEQNEDVDNDAIINEAKEALTNLNLQLAALKRMWDQAQIAKDQLEEIIGISDKDLN